MQKEKIIELKIGDTIYNYQLIKSGLFEYKVLGVREYENAKLYEVECKNCKDHPNCRLLVSQIDNKPQFQYVAMLNDDENDEQYYWHNSGIYYLSKKECIKDLYRKTIKNYQDKIFNLQKEILLLEDKIKELKLFVESKAD